MVPELWGVKFEGQRRLKLTAVDWETPSDLAYLGIIAEQTPN